MRLGIDLDGCIFDFTTSYCKALIEVTKRDLMPQDWKEHEEWITTWYWDRALGYTKEEETKTWQTKILSSSTFWEKLDPLPDARDVTKQLNRLIREGNDVYFLTNRPGKKAKLQTEKALYALGISYPTVLISSNKVAASAGLGGLNFFIDDKIETIHDFMEAGNVNHLYLKDAAYNRAGRAEKLYSDGANTYGVASSVSNALKVAGFWKE